ncbi:TRAP-type C4-dicarboxylate transport system substrate-binding protein [Breoghania corrubedonensis]|uniref:TRAP-type C4-dicarboxylate transport system substrate-binding protein n=1 Tax=Breoghania corrubedonensis TaxID=665038 RepID=A0A2T5UYP4_9HYPH|nr:TRAP transporter substrate-binding protein [Breoghania corrubedonensis]PTW56625.1 TRAP-type C4-dicarboxylate transport system substrate-binding protein [Breoghania corrubedonensis]
MKRLLVACAVSAAFTSAAMAEDLSVVGSWSSLPLHNQYEKPFWETTLPEASAGRLKVNLTTHNQMGLGVGDVFRLLGDGVYDVAMTVSDYAVADAPELEGLDVPLIALDAKTEHAAIDAARPMVEEIFETRFNAHVLAIAPYPPQVVFCNKAIGGLADLKGLKIRASGRMTAKFLEALGAEGVNVAFSEVPGSLQKGVVDCAVTGAGSGYSAGWWEVSSHLLTLPLGGWDPVVTAINKDKWDSLSAEDRDLISTLIKSKFEAPAWAAADGALANDVACLTGEGDCQSGEARAMVLVPASEADMATAREILETVVLPDWGKRAGKDWAERWNASVGKVVEVSIPTN